MDQHGLWGPPRRRTAGICRAIVINTYVANTPTRSLPFVKDATRMVVCDLLLTEPIAALFRVPVMQRVSEGDAAPWIPKPTTRDILRNTPVAMLSPVSRTGVPNPQGPTMPSFEDLDGDHVIVDFIAGNPKDPLIIGAVMHPSTKRRVLDGPGFAVATPAVTRGTAFSQEHYVRHAGTEMRINATGDVLLDTTGADPTDPATEAPTAGPAGGGTVVVSLKAEKEFRIVDETGAVIVRVKKTGGVTSASLEGGVLRSMVLGEPMRDWLLNHQHPTGVGLSAVANNPTTIGTPVNLLTDVLSPRHKVS